MFIDISKCCECNQKCCSVFACNLFLSCIHRARHPPLSFLTPTPKSILLHRATGPLAGIWRETGDTEDVEFKKECARVYVSVSDSLELAVNLTLFEVVTCSVCEWVCLCVCVCVLVWVFVRAHVCACKYVCVCVHEFLCVCLCVILCKCARSSVSAFLCVSDWLSG